MEGWQGTHVNTVFIHEILILKKFLIKNVSLNQRFLLKMNFDLNQTGLQGPVCMRKLLWLHSLAELQGSRVGS